MLRGFLRSRQKRVDGRPTHVRHARYLTDVDPRIDDIQDEVSQAVDLQVRLLQSDLPTATNIRQLPQLERAKRSAGSLAVGDKG
jgi:hypothetical protein